VLIISGMLAKMALVCPTVNSYSRNLGRGISKKRDNQSSRVQKREIIFEATFQPEKKKQMGGTGVNFFACL